MSIDVRKRNPKARPGNRNAAKPDAVRRVALSAMVHPDTLDRIRSIAADRGSLGRAVDFLASEAVSRP